MNEIDELINLVDDDSYIPSDYMEDTFFVDILQYNNSKLIEELLRAARRKDQVSIMEKCIKLLSADTLSNYELHGWVARRGDEVILNALKDAGVTMNMYTQDDRERFFGDMLENGHINLFEEFRLWHTRSHVNFASRAIRSKRLDVLQCVVQNFYGERDENNHLSDSLDNCIFYKRMDMLEYLLKIGADPNLSYYRPLTAAAERGERDMVVRLIYYNANVHHQQEEAFRRAAENGHYDVVKYLLNFDINTSRYKNSALKHARKNGHNEVVKLIEEYNGRRNK